MPCAWSDNTLSLPGPFSWLSRLVDTKCCHTDGGVRPSLESPAVSSYIIAEPCWAHPDCFVRLPLNVIVAKIKRRVRSHSLVGRAEAGRGLPTWSPAETTEQTQSEVFGKRFHVAQREAYPLHFTPCTVCGGRGAPSRSHTRRFVPRLSTRPAKERHCPSWESVQKVLNWANGINQMLSLLFIFFSLSLTVAATVCRYWFTHQMLRWIPVAHSYNQYCLWNIMQYNEFNQQEGGGGGGN